MKKLALSLAVLFAVGVVSCGGNDKKECDSVCDTTPTEEVAVALTEDSVVTPDSVADTTAAVAVETAE